MSAHDQQTGKTVAEILEAVRAGALTPDEAARQLTLAPTMDLGMARIDRERPVRRGIPEVVLCQFKTVEQVTGIVDAIDQSGQNLLCTRVTPEQADAVVKAHPDVRHNPVARTLTRITNPRPEAPGKALVLTAGTSDMPVAEEAVETLAFMNVPTLRIHDVGVAGIHRLFEAMDTIRQAQVIICVAGMEGALPSVVAGLCRAPVIAVPTSVGYGASFGGVAALLGMLNSCSGGIVTVNIDNGFGAAQFADLVLRLRETPVA